MTGKSIDWESEEQRTGEFLERDVEFLLRVDDVLEVERFDTGSSSRGLLAHRLLPQKSPQLTSNVALGQHLLSKKPTLEG